MDEILLAQGYVPNPDIEAGGKRFDKGDFILSIWHKAFTRDYCELRLNNRIVCISHHGDLSKQLKQLSEYEGVLVRDAAAK